jgi:hypothetical protein
VNRGGLGAHRAPGRVGRGLVQATPNPRRTQPEANWEKAGVGWSSMGLPGGLSAGQLSPAPTHVGSILVPIQGELGFAALIWGLARGGYSN